MKTLHIQIRKNKINMMRKALKRINNQDRQRAKWSQMYGTNYENKFAHANRYITGGDDYGTCRLYASYGDKAMIALFDKMWATNSRHFHAISDSMHLSDHSNRMTVRKLVFGEWIAQQETCVGTLFSNGYLDYDYSGYRLSLCELKELQAYERSLLNTLKITDANTGGFEFSLSSIRTSASLMYYDMVLRGNGNKTVEHVEGDGVVHEIIGLTEENREFLVKADAITPEDRAKGFSWPTTVTTSRSQMFEAHAHLKLVLGGSEPLNLYAIADNYKRILDCGCDHDCDGDHANDESFTLPV